MGNQPGKSRLRPQTVGSGFDSLMAHNTSRSSGCEFNHLTCFFAFQYTFSCAGYVRVKRQKCSPGTFYLSKGIFTMERYIYLMTAICASAVLITGASAWVLIPLVAVAGVTYGSAQVTSHTS